MRAARWPVFAGLLACLAVACQPVDEGVPEAGGAAAPAATPGGDEPDALPPDLGALLDRLSPVAAEWQADPVVTEILLDLDGGVWREATVTYLAADADRILVLQASPEGTDQQRPTLETFDLVPVPAGALADVPPLPADALAPAELAERAGEAADCPVGEVDTVLYSSGAPAAWDGTAWTEPPAWTATLGGDGDAVLALDPVTAEPHPDGCLDTT